MCSSENHLHPLESPHRTCRTWYSHPSSNLFNQSLTAPLENIVLKLADSADDSFKQVRDEVESLVGIVKDYPYYKYNGLWTRDLQNTVRLPPIGCFG